MDNANGIIGFGGSLPIIAIFLFVFRTQLNKIQMVVAALTIYILSIATGVVSAVVWNFSDTLSAKFAGFHAPVFYCIIFMLIVFAVRQRRTRTEISPLRSTFRTKDDLINVNEQIKAKGNIEESEDESKKTAIESKGVNIYFYGSVMATVICLLFLMVFFLIPMAGGRFRLY